MNKTTQDFIAEFKNASKEERKTLIDYLRFDYRIQIEELKKYLSEEEYKEITKASHKTFNLEEYVEMRLTDELYELAYEFFKSKEGKKIVKEVVKIVKQELKEKEIPKPYHKREIDRVLSLKLTYKKIFSQIFPMFIEYLKKEKKIGVLVW